jgi:TetR/AcrR family transcriptional regulator, fatty acid metabolism regulator protein
MARTKDPKLEERRRSQIMDAVFRLLVEGSHRSLTLERVAVETGVSKGMVTYYFESKEQLITRTIERFLAMHEAMLQAAARGEGPVEPRLRNLIAVSLSSRENLEQKLRFQAEVWSFAKEVPEAYEAVRRSYVRFRRECESLIEVGIEEGYVTVPDARWVYLLLHSLFDGIAFQIVLDPDIDIEEARERVLRLIDGLLTGTTEERR